MLDSISSFLYRIFSSFELATMFSGMIPLLELKGAICFGVRNGLAWWSALLFGYLGSTAMFFVIFLILRPVLNLLKKVKWFNKFAVKVEDYIQTKADDATKKNEHKNWSAEKIKFFAVFIFVAIPLPLTGVYMGTAIAVFLNMKFYKALIAVALGNMVAGFIITGLAMLCINIIDYILYGLLGLAVVLLVVTIVKIKTSGNKKEIEDKTDEKE